jgi:hypothetical protein
MLSSSDHDRTVWMPSKKGVFDVLSYYNAMWYSTGIIFPWKSTWITKVPCRVVFFVLKTVLGKILTVDNLGGVTI